MAKTWVCIRFSGFSAPDGVQTFEQQTIWMTHVWKTDHLGDRHPGNMGRTFRQHDLDVWVTHRLRMLTVAKHSGKRQLRGDIHSRWHFVGGSILDLTFQQFMTMLSKT